MRWPRPSLPNPETDGRLPTDDSLAEAIEAVDAAAGRAPAYNMFTVSVLRISHAGPRRRLNAALAMTRRAA
jgi:hypothetical protein